LTYSEAKAEATRRANLQGCDFGVEKDVSGYHVLGLPMAKHRMGHELRCEVVNPDRLDKTQPGHGHAETNAQPCGWFGAP
jgi:hypothetical protein